MKQSDGLSASDRFYVALFSAVEQTHCAFVACHSCSCYTFVLHVPLINVERVTGRENEVV